MICTTYTINTQHTIQSYILKNTKRLFLIGGEEDLGSFFSRPHVFILLLYLALYCDYRGGSHLAWIRVIRGIRATWNCGTIK